MLSASLNKTFPSSSLTLVVNECMNREPSFEPTVETVVAFVCWSLLLVVFIVVVVFIYLYLLLL